MHYDTPSFFCLFNRGHKIELCVYVYLGYDYEYVKFVDIPCIMVLCCVYLCMTVFYVLVHKYADRKFGL